MFLFAFLNLVLWLILKQPSPSFDVSAINLGKGREIQALTILSELFKAKPKRMKLGILSMKGALMRT
jgi:hypothetical protein